MTYPEMLVVFVGAALVVWLLARLLRPSGTPSVLAAALAFAALAVLTVVFDNVMIAAGLFEYDHDRLAGIYLGRAPLEDLGYPLAAVLLLPALWHLLGSRGRSAREPGPER